MVSRTVLATCLAGQQAPSARLYAVSRTHGLSMRRRDASCRVNSLSARPWQRHTCGRLRKAHGFYWAPRSSTGKVGRLSAQIVYPNELNFRSIIVKTRPENANGRTISVRRYYYDNLPSLANAITRAAQRFIYSVATSQKPGVGTHRSGGENKISIYRTMGEVRRPKPYDLDVVEFSRKRKKHFVVLACRVPLYDFDVQNFLGGGTWGQFPALTSIYRRRMRLAMMVRGDKGIYTARRQIRHHRDTHPRSPDVLYDSITGRTSRTTPIKLRSERPLDRMNGIDDDQSP
ncbi:hypothetical protein Bbelb_260330 [Branchiostoma belcheri]|nr:hypothetical protein Bbelb_260330 [Branchiostoma belcheri]